MHDAALATFSAIAIVLCILPVPMQWRARNTGTLLNIFWNLVGNTIWLLNVIIWWDRFDDQAPLLCDFTVKLQTALAPGLSAASLCINRRLATIAMSRAVSSSPNKKRIDLAIDLSLGIGLPIVLMALSYIVQGHRYDIFEGFGCELAYYVSIPAVVILFISPIILGVISAVYGGLAISFFLSRRLQFNALLRSSQSGLDTNQYVRLVALASLDLFISLPLHIFFLAQAAPGSASRVWPGFADVHYNWHRIEMVAFATYSQSSITVCIRMLARWLSPILAIVFFIFFGVSRDAIAEYRRYYAWGRDKLGGSSSRSVTHAAFIPKLGSAIAEPLGAGWSSVRRDAEDVEAGLGSPLKDKDDCLGGGMSVVVRVEKETL